MRGLFEFLKFIVNCIFWLLFIANFFKLLLVISQMNFRSWFHIAHRLISVGQGLCKKLFRGSLSLPGPILISLLYLSDHALTKLLGDVFGLRNAMSFLIFLFWTLRLAVLIFKILNLAHKLEGRVRVLWLVTLLIKVETAHFLTLHVKCSFSLDCWREGDLATALTSLAF